MRVTRGAWRLVLAATALGLATWSVPLRAGDRDIGGGGGTAEVVEGKKVALVIGNGSYANVGRLEQAPRDARLIADTLSGLGFTVKSYYDLDRSRLSRAAVDFEGQLRGSAVGFFYYAGHGVQVNGHNYLVPVDARISDEKYVDSEAVDVTQVLQSMERARSRLNVVVLDACRNNPFAGQWTAGGRSVAGGGLAGVDVAPRGSVIAYATAPGRVATDDGVYARSLATHLRAPGTEITDVFRLVYAEVEGASNSGQSPWYTESRNPGRFYPGGVPVVEGSGTVDSNVDVAALAATETAFQQEADKLRAKATAEWKTVEPLLARRDAGTRAVVEAYVTKWGTAKVTVGGKSRAVEIAEATAATRLLAGWKDVTPPATTTSAPTTTSPPPVTSDFASAAVVASRRPTRMAMSTTSASVAPGGSVTLVVVVSDAAGRGVSDVTLDFLTSSGKLGAVTEVAAGRYEATLTVPTAATGDVKVSVATRDGAVSQFMRVPVAKPEAAAASAATGSDWTSPTLGVMKWIPAGSFLMGSPEGVGSDEEHPQRKVTLTKGYWLMEHEVTQGEWSAVMGRNPSHFAKCGSACPVECVSWDDALAFVDKVSERDGVTYRLPTEAEWERAARGGQYDTFAGSADPRDVGWYMDNSAAQAHPACQKARNGYGLCDMTGNVSEWTGDWYSDSYSWIGGENPTGASAGTDRIHRGGGWNTSQYYTRVANRGSLEPSRYSAGIGLRLARPSP